MKTFDELTAMTSEELSLYRDAQIEKVISNANPKNVLKLRALHAKVKSLDKIKSPLVRADKANRMMMDSVVELNELIKGGY